MNGRDFHPLNPRFITSERDALPKADEHEPPSLDVSELLHSRLQEQILRENRLASFQKAICALPLTPEQVKARVESLFAEEPPASATPPSADAA